MRIFYALLWVIAGSFAPPVLAQQPSPAFSPVLIELYTAENCPYCPPADELLAQLTKMPGVYGIACHVDYLGEGRLGLTRPFCRQRQQAYVEADIASRIYTPMMILNGRHEAIGYRGDKVSAALMKARAENIAPIVIQKGEGLMFTYTLPALPIDGAPVSLWMMMFDSPHYGRAIPSRNEGKPLAYVNAAGLYQILGKWDGSAQTKKQPMMIGGIRKGIIIAAQNDVNGQIVALGRYMFDENRPARSLSGPYGNQ